MPVVMTAHEMDRQNKTFWAGQKILMERRLKRPEFVLVAVEFLAEEAKRHVPVGYRRSFERALQDAENAADIVVRALSEDPAFAKPTIRPSCSAT